jgi:hypothetical protein
LEIGGVCRSSRSRSRRAGFVLPARRCVRRGSAFRSDHRIRGADRDALRACQPGRAGIAAKIGEIKAGLTAEAIAAIEADHRALLEKATAKAGEITAEETRIAAAAPAQVKPWAAAFYASAEAANMSLTDLNAIVTASATHEAAKDALIAKMAAAHNPTVPLANGARATIIADGTDKFKMGVTKSIIGRVSMFNTKGKPDAEGERNEFSGYSMRELARMSLEVRGIRNLPHDPMAMIAMAMAPVVMAAGQLSTSDFVNVLANVANKAMLKGYEESPKPSTCGPAKAR